jgi:serine/threonine protein kinase
MPKSARYEFEKPIGSGGMGVVYRALDRRTKEPVAIKVLKHRLSENPILHQRLIREFKAATELEHPNVVRALSCETDGEVSFLVYELVDGGSLADRIEQFGRLPEDVAVRIVTQIAQALQYAHDRKIIHRDVKPDNILLLSNGQAKLADFGLAKDFGGEQDVDLTRQASGLGTPNYMAPEQFADAKNVDARSDIYSLGATLYNLVTGVLPFEGKTVLATLTMKELMKYKPVRTLVPGSCDRTEAAIKAALEPDADRRPQTCLEFFKLLTGRRRMASDVIKTPAPLSSVRLPSENRRRKTRFPLRVGACAVVDPSIHGGGEQDRWPLVIRDVSTTGIGVLLARRFESGTDLNLELQYEGNKGGWRIPLRVVRVQVERAGHWIHGCELAKPLTDEQLRMLVKFA